MARESYRLTNCALCGAQMRLCSDCDRYHRYCSETCAQEARRQSVREAGRRYQATEKGAANNCLRQERFRARVTHQSSPISPPARETAASGGVVVATTVATIDTDVFEEGRHVESPDDRRVDPVLRCTICGRELPPYARRGFLPPPRRRYRRGARPRIFWAPPLG